MSINDIRIRQCKNGFIVESFNDSECETSQDEVLVFQSMNELIGFIKSNFIYRSLHLQSDGG